MWSKWETILQNLWIISRFTSYFYQTVHFIEDDALPTLTLVATPSGFTLHYNKTFIEKYSNDELTGLLVHEMMHVMSNHTHRMLPGKDILLQNLAQDMVINTYIYENRKDFFSRTGRDIRDESAVVLPDGLPLIPDNFYAGSLAATSKYDPSWEDVYDWLVSNPDEKIVNTTDSSEGGGNLDSRFQMPDFSLNNNSEKSEIIPDFFNDDDGIQFKDDNENAIPAGVHLFREKSLDDTVFSMKKRVVSYAARDENATGERLYQEISAIINRKRPAKIKNFDKLLKRFLNQALCSEDWGFSSRRFNRRYFGEGIYAPGRLYQQQPSVTVAIDVSGSMMIKPELIEKAFGAIESLLNRYKVYLICIDEDVFVPRIDGNTFVASENQADRYLYRRGDWKYIKTAGNAATFFSPLFEVFMAGKKEPLIVITDGEIYDMDMLIPYKDTLWAVPEGSETKIQPPFGKVAVIE